MSILNQNIDVREVWADNLGEEMKNISRILQRFPFISLKSEFDRQNITKSNQNSKCNYTELKTNVDKLDVSKLGFTLFDRKGNLPSCGRQYCIWQFNFRDINNKEKGIKILDFCNQLKSSGLISDDNRQWVTFSGAYELGFLIKMLTGKTLPETLQEFYAKLKELFPLVYDIKHVRKFSLDMDEVARKYAVERFCFDSQVGSDSLLMARIYVTLDAMGASSLKKKDGSLYGLADK